jgi:hypothetical protein
MIAEATAVISGVYHRRSAEPFLVMGAVQPRVILSRFPSRCDGVRRAQYSRLRLGDFAAPCLGDLLGTFINI